MAHECPECGIRCHCGGDIDDITFELEGYCNHCDGFDEDDDFEDDSDDIY